MYLPWFYHFVYVRPFAQGSYRNRSVLDTNINSEYVLTLLYFCVAVGLVYLGLDVGLCQHSNDWKTNLFLFISVLAKLSNLELKMESSQKTILKAITETSVSSTVLDQEVEFDFKFPINDSNTLIELEERLKDKTFEHHFIKAVEDFKPLKNSKCFHFGIKQLFSDEMIIAYNWDGLQNRRSLRDFMNFNYALYGEFFGHFSFVYVSKRLTF